MFRGWCMVFPLASAAFPARTARANSTLALRRMIPALPLNVIAQRFYADWERYADHVVRDGLLNRCGPSLRCVRFIPTSFGASIRLPIQKIPIQKTKNCLSATD